MNITFRKPNSFAELKTLIDFLWAQNLGYPNYDDWVLRALGELDDGYKKAIIAYDDNVIVGSIIFQPHKELSGIREIKNLRVSPHCRSRRFGSFLLRQCEWFESQTFHSLLCDFRADQEEVERLLVDEGFRIVSVRSLYDDRLDKIALRANRYKEKKN